MLLEAAAFLSRVWDPSCQRFLECFGERRTTLSMLPCGVALEGHHLLPFIGDISRGRGCVCVTWVEEKSTACPATSSERKAAGKLSWQVYLLLFPQRHPWVLLLEQQASFKHTQTHPALSSGSSRTLPLVIVSVISKASVQLKINYWEPERFYL